MPSSNEMVVLRIVKEAGKANKFTVSQKTEIATRYANYMLAMLTKKKYLSKSTSGKYGGYTLTPKGEEAVQKARVMKEVTDSEIKILKIVAGLKRAHTSIIGRKLRISPDYAGFLCKSLGGKYTKAKYLKETGPGVYELTPMGEEIVAEGGS